VITLHGRKAAREPFAFLTCSLISYFWAGHAVISFCFEENISFALELNNWLDDPRNILSQGQLLYVPSLAIPYLGQNTRSGSGGLQDIGGTSPQYRRAHMRANTDTHQLQVLPDNTITLEHPIHIQPWETPAESPYA
jgi:hypothetical protein